MNRNALFGSLLAMVLLTGCHLMGVQGSGNVTTETRTISGISGVSVIGAGHLIIDQNGDESLTITTDDNLLSRIRSDVNGGVLELGPRNHESLDSSEGIVYRLSVRSLDQIDVSGVADVDADGVDIDNLKIRISGAAKITVKGAADRQDIRISGVGKFDGRELDGQDIAVDISGAGQALVSASRTLRANVSGAGNIQYVGDPRLTSNVSGVGSIHKQ